MQDEPAHGGRVHRGDLIVSRARRGIIEEVGSSPPSDHKVRFARRQIAIAVRIRAEGHLYAVGRRADKVHRDAEPVHVGPLRHERHVRGDLRADCLPRR